MRSGTCTGYQIKILRAELLDGRIPKADYANHVVELRKRYWLLSVPVQLWTAEVNRRNLVEGFFSDRQSQNATGVGEKGRNAKYGQPGGGAAQSAAQEWKIRTDHKHQ